MYLIEILHQTTTRPSRSSLSLPLYLIEILHQTTTLRIWLTRKIELYLIEILHQTTTAFTPSYRSFRCILLKFYIKPQQAWYAAKYYRVVSYWNSTSNHNSCLCINEETAVVSYWNSTSNHNNRKRVQRYWLLYLIEILHQTTTRPKLLWLFAGCILLKFYIKPQQCQTPEKEHAVVSYWNSTSNHNKLDTPLSITEVVSYWNSTSNHNRWSDFLNSEFVVSYWNSTSNHNSCLCINEETAVVSYWNSTSNHNYVVPLNYDNEVVSYWNSTSNHNTYISKIFC